MQLELFIRVVLFITLNYMTHHLKFGLGLAGVGADTLGQAETTVLDLLDLLVLFLVGSLVFLLEFFNQNLEVGFGLGHLVLGSFDFFFEEFGGKRLQVLDALLGVGITKINVGGGALRLQVLLGKLTESIQISATFIILQRSGVTMLQGGETLDSIGVTHGLTLISGAINLGDEGAFLAFPFCGKGVPSGGHRLAMSAPGGVHLKKNGPAGGQLIVVVLGQVDGGGAGNEGGKLHEHD